MKKLLLLMALLSLSTTYCVAQRYLKIFGGFEKIDVHSINIYAGDTIDFQSQYIGISKPTFACTKYKKEGKKFIEIMVGNFSLFKNDALSLVKNNQLNVPVDGEAIYKIGGTIGYSQNFMFLDDASQRHAAWLGGGIRLQSDFQKTKPKTSLSFPLTSFKNNLNLLLIPRYTYKFKEKYILDVQFPIGLAEVGLNYLNQQNPTVSIYQKRQLTPSANFYAKLDEIKIGFGMIF
jgi:hypothetical protein